MQGSHDSVTDWRSLEIMCHADTCCAILLLLIPGKFQNIQRLLTIARGSKNSFIDCARECRVCGDFDWLVWLVVHKRLRWQQVALPIPYKIPAVHMTALIVEARRIVHIHVAFACVCYNLGQWWMYNLPLTSDFECSCPRKARPWTDGLSFCNRCRMSLSRSLESWAVQGDPIYARVGRRRIAR